MEARVMAKALAGARLLDAKDLIALKLSIVIKNQMNDLNIILAIRFCDEKVNEVLHYFWKIEI